MMIQQASNARRPRGVWFGVLAFLLISMGVSEHASGLNIDSLHWAAWDSSLAQADSDPAVRYSFYARRALAVPHPEVYLLADQLFSEVIARVPGSRAAYNHPNPAALGFYRLLRFGEMKGPAFSWKRWSIVADSVQDDFVPGEESWLDLRLPPAFVLLRAVSPRLSTAECAMLSYTHRRRTGRESDDLFVVIDSDGHGFLVDDTLVLSGGIRAWDGSPNDISPVLVFNERSVFYPLFGRDDRDSDQNLRRVVESLGSPALLNLPVSDLRRISGLRRAAALPNDSSVRLAVLMASGLHETRHKAVRQAWSSLWSGEDIADLDCVSLGIAAAHLHGNRLSREAAARTSALQGDDLGARLAGLESLYRERCGRPADSSGMSVRMWGINWVDGFFLLGIDDLMRTKAGEGSSHALAIAATLDLMGISHTTLGIFGGELHLPDQEWVLVDNGRYQFSSGELTEVPLDVRENSTVRAISGYRHRGRSALFGQDAVCANCDALTLTSDLARISRLLPGVALSFSNGGKVVPRRKMMSLLANDIVPVDEFNWPSDNAE